MRPSQSIPVALAWLPVAASAVTNKPSLLIESRQQPSPDNTCGNIAAGDNNNYTCPESLPCCSINGWCGSTDAYCGAGCQPGFGTCGSGQAPITSPDNTCGLKGAGANRGYICPSNLGCCSTNGWCGSTEAYCGTGCQSAFGECDTPSTAGRCGVDFNNQSCADNECCSTPGYCGTTEDYCAAPDCQFEFGPACDSNKIPAGSNTSTIARPPLGSVLVGGAGITDCQQAGVVALTFDDGPDEYTSDLLDLLDQYNAKATFFITGNNNGRGEIDDASTPWPGIIRRAYASSHQIASHTYSHADLSTLSSARRKDEMYKNEMAIRNVLGNLIPTYMRPPYSSCTSASGCTADMTDLGYHITEFDLDTKDYLNDSPELIQNSKDTFDAFFGPPQPDNGLVIAHDIHFQTVYNLTEYMLGSLERMGYEMVTVGDCLGDPSENWYRVV